MRLSFTPRFRRRAAKLTSVQRALLRASLRRFAVDPRDPLLRAHKLAGDLAEFWASSVDDDLRVLFRWDDDLATLVTIGSPDEVY